MPSSIIARPAHVAAHWPRGAALFAAALAVTACKRRNPLEPAEAAEVVPGIDDGAETREAGVRLVARTQAWTGSPDILDDVTPVWVEITNTTEDPLAVRYGDFRLVAVDGTEYVALPPFATDGSAKLPVPYANGGYPGFWGAPYYAPRPYTTGPYPYAWYAPVGYDYDYYYNGWVEVPLPTPRMVQRALPEGALDPGARAAGFIYFPRVADEERAVDLRFALTDAKSNEQFALASIPFRVDDFL